MDKLTEVKEFIGQKLERIEFQETTNNPIFVFVSGSIYITDFLKLKKMFSEKHLLQKEITEANVTRTQ